MGPKRRERFNAKARQSSVGGSSHKKRKAVRVRSSVEADANAPIMDEETRAALAEQDRQRRQLLREGGNDETMKITSKKRRRLDKFIESKLRKEEKARILEKLAKSSADIGDRTELVSAATLGTGRVSKESERVQKILKEKESGFKRKRAEVFQIQEDDDDKDLDAESSSDDEPVMDREHVMIDEDERQKRILEAVKKFETPSYSVGSALAKPAGPALSDKVGSALKKGADGQTAMPIMRKRERKGRVQGRTNLSIKERIIRGKNEVPRESHDTDSSFDSSDEDDELDANVYDVDKMLEKKREKQKADDEDSVATEDLESEEPDTDADEEAVLLEAMKRRGLLPPDAESIPEDMMEGDEDEEDEDEEGEEEDDEDDDEEDDEDEDDDDEEEDGMGLFGFELDDKPKSKRQGIGESERSRGFKEWALGALKLVRPTQDSSDERPLEPVGGRIDRVRDLGPQDGKVRGPLGQEAFSTRSPFTERYYSDEEVFRQMGEDAPIRHVPVTRPQHLQDARMRLPVVAEEDYILRTIQENPVTVICGETGSGKTTQVPQFLYEAAYATAGSGTLM